MKITKRLVLPLALLFMLACARGQDIHYNHDRGANFAAYKTYQWVDVLSDPPHADIPNGLPEVNLPDGAPPIDIPGGGPFGDIRGGAQEDQLTAQAIKRAIDEQLAQKGLTKVEKRWGYSGRIPGCPSPGA